MKVHNDKIQYMCTAGDDYTLDGRLTEDEKKQLNDLMKEISKNYKLTHSYIGEKK